MGVETIASNYIAAYIGNDIETATKYSSAVSY